MHPRGTVAIRRALALVVLACVFAAVSPTPAAASGGGDAAPRTAVARALHDRAILHQRLRAIRAIPGARRELLRARPSLAEAVLARHGARIERREIRHILLSSRRLDVRRSERLRRLGRTIEERVEDLREQIAAKTWWLQTVGIFRACPIPGYTQIYDDFGQMVRLPKVPVHRHMGSDVLAPTWSPIVAPFDGYASGSRSHLGGIEVRVRGDVGYVYNAHLIAFEQLGWVRTGDVIGYVGSTGDATAPHDHFEWHPWDGGAVDPYPYLVAACVKT